jgi:hypothetical protein
MSRFSACVCHEVHVDFNFLNNEGADMVNGEAKRTQRSWRRKLCVEELHVGAKYMSENWYIEKKAGGQ